MIFEPEKKWLKVLDMLVDDFLTPWCHPKPPGLKTTTKTLSNGMVAYIHNWICVEYDDELKWLVKQHYNAFPRTCKNEETIAALKVPGEFRLGPLQLMHFHHHCCCQRSSVKNVHELLGRVLRHHPGI